MQRGRKFGLSASIAGSQFVFIDHFRKEPFAPLFLSTAALKQSHEQHFADSDDIDMQRRSGIEKSTEAGMVRSKEPIWAKKHCRTRRPLLADQRSSMIHRVCPQKAVVKFVVQQLMCGRRYYFSEIDQSRLVHSAISVWKEMASSKAFELAGNQTREN